MSVIEAVTPTEKLNDVVSSWLKKFDELLSGSDIQGALELFVDQCYWRDLVSFTWNISTAEGKSEVANLLETTLSSTLPTGWTIDGDAQLKGEAIEAWIAFETKVGRGSGFVRLVSGRCWTILTTLTELKGFEEPCGFNRSRGAEHGVHRDRKTWLERKTEEETTLGYSRQPYVLVIGGGQGGIGLGARLKQLGVPTIIIEKNPRAGDSWRNRYNSLCLHDPVWYDHMPYIPFPKNWPVYSPKDKIGDWLEMYVKVMELNYWSSSECVGAKYDIENAEWVVDVLRDGEHVTIRPKHLVLATGMSGLPNIPEFPGQEKFKGIQLHSSQFRESSSWAGKNAVVIGSNNSAHDICADLWEHRVNVTMVQRTGTMVVRSESLAKHTMSIYSEEASQNGLTTEMADLANASVPFRLMPEFDRPSYDRIRATDKDFYERLEKAGFKVDWSDGSGLFMKYARRASGYYIDVGASELVASGEIKLKATSGVDHISENGVVFADGEELPADLIVYATGYGSMNGWAARIISQEVADEVGKCWGLGSDTPLDPGPWEGELRNMWKPTAHSALWFHGGNLYQSRQYSQYLALQLKARLEGIPTPVYGRPDVHHKA